MTRTVRGDKNVDFFHYGTKMWTKFHNNTMAMHLILGKKIVFLAISIFQDLVFSSKIIGDTFPYSCMFL
jgi:hypothetical protein